MSAGRVRRSLGVVVLVVAVGACSGGDEASGDGVARGDVDQGGAVDQSVEADPVVAENAELKEALLTLDDVPDGLIDLGLHYSGVEICGLRTEMPEPFEGEEFPAAGVAFALDDEPIVPDVLEKIVVVPAGAGAEVFQRARELLDVNCTDGGEVDGLAFVGSSDLTVPTQGEESVARRVTIEEVAGGTTVGMDILYARAGDTIVTVGVVEPEGETDQLVELATIAFDRATTS